MISGNKGEWSELYVFLKLLGEGKIYGADKNLNKIRELCYPVVEIKREQNLYKPNTSARKITIIDGHTHQIIVEMEQNTFEKNAQLLLNRIKLENNSFAIAEIEQFMKKIKCLTLKAPSTDKSDINVVLHDIQTMRDVSLGFSIKSKLGSPSTLLNASTATNFIFQIKGALSSQDIERINAFDEKGKIKHRINQIYAKKCRLEYEKIESPVFETNLQVIDSKLPEIMASMLIDYYSGEETSIAQLTEDLVRRNPCKFHIECNTCFYSYKIKNMLTDIALGMTPSSQWNGIFDATGGYIVVKECGEIVCYHVYNRNEFREYLFENTRLDTPSSTRHKFGLIYQEGGHNKIKLNLQIRFL